MDFRNELERIKKIIEDMPMPEFEEMLFDCGLGVIRPSGESLFVKTFNNSLFDKDMNYIREEKNYLSGNYQAYNDFDYDEKGEVA